MKKIIPFPGDFPLSRAIVHDAKYTMEVSGFIGMNYDKGMLEEGIEEQTRRVMINIQETLEKTGWTTSNIVKSRIFLTDMKDYEAMNKVYASFFDGGYPTRFALEVSALPAGGLVEIECVAVGDEISE